LSVAIASSSWLIGSTPKHAAPSAPVTIPRTPGTCSARDVSMRRIFACGTVDRSSRQMRVLGKRTSSP
jgi:hypothetical protein